MQNFKKANRQNRSTGDLDNYRKRNKQNLIILEYVVGETMLKGIQLRSSRISCMGVPHANGHYFYPEEAVWLMESALGSIIYNGVALSVQQGYHLLESHGIVWPQYAVYSYLKCSGYVVIPHNRSIQLDCPNELQSNYANRKTLKFPSELLDQFPSMNNSTGYIDLKPLHTNESIAKKFDISANFPSTSNRFFKTDQQDSNKEQVRPRYWPRFDSFAHKSSSWAKYRKERAKVLNRNKKRKAPPSTITKHSSFSHIPQESVSVDYNVYAGDGSYKHTLVPAPLFHILIVKDLTSGFPSIAYLHALSAKLQNQRLVLAVANYSSILFYDIDHRPIQLR